VVGVCVLGGAAAVSGAFCSSCFLTYVFVAGYAGIALFGWQQLGCPNAREVGAGIRRAGGRLRSFAVSGPAHAEERG
jgi:hypothetical protein